MVFVFLLLPRFDHKNPTTYPMTANKPYIMKSGNAPGWINPGHIATRIAGGNNRSNKPRRRNLLQIYPQTTGPKNKAIMPPISNSRGGALIRFLLPFLIYLLFSFEVALII